MNDDFKSMRCCCCTYYDSFEGCRAWDCCPKYSILKIKEEAKEQGMSVADIVALLELRQ